MSDTLMTIIGIFVAVVLMFVFPLIAFTSKTDEISQTVVETAVSDFVIAATTKGEITQFDYETLEQKLYSTGNTYDIQIEAQILDDNPRRVTTTGDKESLGEYKYYSVYTNTILEQVEKADGQGRYPLKKDDYLIVTVKNTNTTIGTQFKNILYKMIGKETYTIGTTASGLVCENNDSPTISIVAGAQPTIITPPPEEVETVTLTYYIDPKDYEAQYKSTNNWVNKITYYASKYQAEILDEVTIWQETYPKGSKVRPSNKRPNITLKDPQAIAYFFNWWLDPTINTKKVYDYNKNDKITLNQDTILYAYYAFDRPDGSTIWHKPVIYLYPQEETQINVQIACADKLTVSYPQYKENGWNVFAKPDGTLKDLETSRELYCLYYEANNDEDPDVYKDGFIVKGEDTARFLEEKLAILGLNEKEAEEFIIYWLPRLEVNKYNYIRFASEEYINNTMPLEINPAPETLIRVLMEFEGLEEPIEIEEQELKQRTRKGYTVVEWGVTDI